MKIQKIQVEEKYGMLLKEKLLMKDKERILMNTFDALNKLNSGREKESDEEDIVPVVRNASENDVFSCTKCDFKATIRHRLDQHMKDKHLTLGQPDGTSDDVVIPCDICDFESKTVSEFRQAL